MVKLKDIFPNLDDRKQVILAVAKAANLFEDGDADLGLFVWRHIEEIQEELEEEEVKRLHNGNS